MTDEQLMRSIEASFKDLSLSGLASVIFNARTLVQALPKDDADRLRQVVMAIFA